MSARTSVPKRLIKKWGRRAFVGCSRLRRLFARDGETDGIRILTYHRIASDPGDPFAVAPQEFALQMKLLAESRSVTTLHDALEAQSDTADRQSIVLTFDDGTADFVDAALPVLSRLHLPAILYVNPSSVGTQGFVSWKDLRQLSTTGVRVGSHSLDHISLGSLSRDEVRRQVAVSRAILEEQIGSPVDSFAYPFGTFRDFGGMAKNEIRSAGYKTACTSINGLNRSAIDPFELRRTKIEQCDGPIFIWILAGCLDAWSLIDRYLSALQNRYA